MPKHCKFLTRAGTLYFKARGHVRSVPKIQKTGERIYRELPELPRKTKIKPNAKYINLVRVSPVKSPSVKPLADAVTQRYQAFLGSSPKNRVFVVAIGGAEGTAKTFLAFEIKRLLGAEIKIRTLAMDDYYKLSRRERKRKVQELKQKGRMGREDLMIFEISNDPALSDFQLLLRHIDALKQGRAVKKHFYDHSNGEIIRNCKTVQPPGQGILLVEGVYALRKELKQAADLNVFVFAEEEKKYQRVSKRDATERAHGIYRSNKYFFEAQLTSYRRYVEPTIRNADIIVNTTHLFD